MTIDHLGQPILTVRLVIGLAVQVLTLLMSLRYSYLLQTVSTAVMVRPKVEAITAPIGRLG